MKLFKFYFSNSDQDGKRHESSTYPHITVSATSMPFNIYLSTF